MWAARRISTPHTGKAEMAKTRMRAAAGIIARNGALGVATTQVVAGYGAGSMHLYSYIEGMGHGAEVSSRLMTDPSWAALMADREASPSAEVVGPEIGRLVAGAPDPSNTAMLAREWIMPRENMQAAADMVPELQKMTSAQHVNTTRWAPVVGSDMSRITVVYSAADLIALGKGVDGVGMSAEFQAMVVEASKLGKLDRAWTMVTFQ